MVKKGPTGALAYPMRVSRRAVAMLTLCKTSRLCLHIRSCVFDARLRLCVCTDDGWLAGDDLSTLHSNILHTRDTTTSSLQGCEAQNAFNNMLAPFEVALENRQTVRTRKLCGTRTHATKNMCVSIPPERCLFVCVCVTAP